MGDTLGDKLIDQQALFQQSVKGIYAELAGAVDLSLRESLAASGRLAGEGIRPLVQETMAGIGKQAEATHERLTRIAQQQLDSVAERFDKTAAQVASSWQQGVGEQQHCNEALLAGLDKSLTGFSDSFERAAGNMLANFEQGSDDWRAREQAADQCRLQQWSTAFEQLQQRAAEQLGHVGQQIGQQLEVVNDRYQSTFETTTREFASTAGSLTTEWLHAGQKMTEFSQNLGAQLSTLRREEAQRDEAAVARLASLEATVAGQLAALGKELEQPLARLIAAAAETPRAAAQLISDLRGEMSSNIERDNEMLEERRKIMEQLDGLATVLQQNTGQQSAAVAQLVAAASDVMQQASHSFGDQLGAELVKVSKVAEIFTAGAAEMASLGESFGLAIGLFNESNTRLLESLGRIEESLASSSARSDEQMAYYVAQAREIIDQSLLSQREVFEQLQQLGEPQLASTEAQ